ncbi:TonB-dependent receptor [Microbulbifer aggregans]|uniref:TonB-dependent receptor n=1 Tax=Microbulbifer aggregans TaxID=1769779 RepID=UPI001CFD99B5|nr:TonB-dependent receptor [Microbulbifer aggregans]
MGYRSNIKHKLVLAIAAAQLGVVGVPVFAQDSQEGSGAGQRALEEVVVTARKREESMQSVPIAVTALDAATLEARQIGAVEDLGRAVPNLLTTPASGSPTNTRIFMRGLGQGESSQPTAESAVGLYIDDVYVARSNGANIGLYDIERIEVLRGPQGSLYGRNSTTGAIKVVTRKPTAEPDFSLRLSTGELDNIGGKLSGSVAVGSDWAAGVSAMYFEQGGYISRIDSTSGEQQETGLNAREYGGVRATLSRLVQDDFSADLSVYYFTDDGDASYITPMDAATGAPLFDGDLYATGTSAPQFATADQFGFSANLAREFGEFTLRSITAYRNVENDNLIDISGRDSWYIDTQVDSAQFSQEIQLLGSAFEQRLDWLAGLYYLSEQSDSLTTNTISQFIQSTQDYTVETDSQALFGQATWHASDIIDLTLGLRYTRDDKTFDGSTESNIIFQNGANRLRKSFDDVTPKFGVDIQATDEMMMYASVAKGFKAGGFQGRALNADDQLVPYDAEQVWTYEAGIKSEWLQNRLRFNANYFLNQFKDLQLNSLNIQAGGGTVIQNAAEAEVDGIEMELTYMASDRLFVVANYATAWGDYEELAANVSGVTLDSELPGTPRVNASIGVEHSTSFSAGELLWGLDYQHTSEVQPGASTSPLVEVPRLDLFNGFVKFTDAGERWSVGLFGTNLGDKAYHYTGFTFSSFEAVYAASPRLIKAVVDYRF